MDLVTFSIVTCKCNLRGLTLSPCGITLCLVVRSAFLAWRALPTHRDARDPCPLVLLHYNRCPFVGRPGPPLRLQNQYPPFLVDEVPNCPRGVRHREDIHATCALFNVQLVLLSDGSNCTSLRGFSCISKQQLQIYYSDSLKRHSL